MTRVNNVVYLSMGDFETIVNQLREALEEWMLMLRNTSSLNTITKTCSFFTLFLIRIDNPSKKACFFDTNK